MQRILQAIASALLFAVVAPRTSHAQSTTAPTTAAAPIGGDETDLSLIQPILPPGISDFDLELYGRLANTWTTPEKAQAVVIQGDFTARMGQYKLQSRHAVAWFTKRVWQNKTYLDVEIFLWQDAEIHQPAGTLDTGPALLVTLRTFGKLVLNADAHSATSDADSDLFKEASKARRLLVVAPPAQADKSGGPLEIAPTVEQLRIQRPKIAKKVDFSADKLSYEQHQDQSVVIAIGEVLVSQGSPAQSGEYVEIRADAAVIYLNKEQVDTTMPGFMSDDGSEKQPKEKPTPPDRGAPRINEEKQGRSDRVGTQAAREWAQAVYLEGDVVLTRGQRMIRAARLYYDFEEEKALILDVVTRAVEPTRALPIYVRAQEVRQLSATEYEAHKAQFTTSEFHTPHVAIGADKVILIDRTPKNEAGDVVGVQAGTYKAYNTTLNLEGLPIAYWPASRGDFSRDRMAFRSAKLGYNGDFGATFETRWHLFNLMGLETPEGYDATLKMDYFTDRGPATGIDMDYEREDYMGLLRTYYINDHGEDDMGGERGSIEPDHENRGRALWRHRQFLPKDWELNLEGAYLSDDNYLESYERNEFENGKEQENAIYLVKREDNWQFSTLANWRMNEFLTQTEHLPDARFTLIGEPIGEFMTAYSDSRMGVVRYRPDDRRFWNGQDRRDNTGETGSVLRGDTREELAFALPDLGPVKLTPYVAGRVSGYDDGPSGWHESNSGGFGRAFGSYGLRGNMMMSKVDDTVESELLDLHRLRHIIKPDFGLWNAHSNRHPDELTPFDSGIEDTDDFGGGTVGVRNRFQTQRGGPGRYRTVDWIIFDMEAGFFTNKEESEDVPNEVYGKRDRPIRAFNPDVKSNRSHGDYIYSRPEDSISSNFIATNFQYRLSDSTVLVHDNVFDTNRGNMGTSNISLAVEREPRLAYFVGWRYIHDTESNIVALGGNYKLSEKHTVAVRELYDIDEGRNISTELVYVRRWPRWHSAVTLDVDKTLDDVGINFSVWPEGAPNLGLGSKRYTGLGDSVGLNVR